MAKNKNKNNNGFAAILVIVMLMSLVLIITFSLSMIITTKSRISKSLVLSARSYYSAESGIEDALLRITDNDYNWTAINSFTLDGSTVSQDITQVGDLTMVESLSSYYNNERKVKTELSLTVDDISFQYGVQVGMGGLTMGNGSEVTGDLYSDGSVSGDGTITGDLIVATGMDLDLNGVWDTYNDDFVFGRWGDPTDIAISFTPTATGILSQVSFYLKNSNPTHSSGTIMIIDGNVASPSTTVLTTDTFLTSKIGSSYGWVNFSFSSPVSLTGGSVYWIVVNLDSENNKHFSIGRDVGNANSISMHSPDWSGGSWTTDPAGDYEYKAWIGGLSTNVDGTTITGNACAHEIKNCTITGDAYYQTESSNTIGGTSYPGSPDPPVVALPISDSNIADWKADALAFGILDSSLCNISENVTINGGKLICPSGFEPDPNIHITLKGTLWIEGDLTFNNNNKLILDSSYGGKSGIIIVDDPNNKTTKGKIYIEQNIIICGTQGLNVAEDGCAESNDTYILILSTHSGETSYAIEVRNNADGAIFYAHSGIAFIKNNADLKEVTAYELILDGTAKVTYESGLADASFTSGPGGGWIISNWNEIQ